LLQQLLSDPIKRLTLHSDIELTEQEITEALIEAKSKKDTRLQYEKATELRREKSDELFRKWDRQELIDFCLQFYFDRFRKSFMVDGENTALVLKLADYFSGRESFKAGGYSLDKGILIMGNVGTGKTELMKFFQKNKKCCYSIKPVNDIAGEFSIYKNEIDDVYSTPIEKPLNDPDVFFQRKIGYCFDDLGTEEIKNDYGNKKNVMADILMAIYSKKQFSKFHITTNLSSEEIAERYGTRISSRLREMFNVFAMSGTDRRK
jgi:hypothetical protein